MELFVYVPDATGVWPCLLDIHGGGWNARQVEADKPMMERLAQRGYVTALVSYRLACEAAYPAALLDCKAAIIEGEKDTVRIGRAEMMDPLKAFGIETSVHTLKGDRHPFWMSDPLCAEVVEIADAFFEKHLETGIQEWLGLAQRHAPPNPAGCLRRFLRPARART